MWFLLSHFFALSFICCLAEDSRQHGPVFEEQPLPTIYPKESEEAKVSLNCRVRANPPPVYRWKVNNRDINVDDTRYNMIGGNLVINNPEEVKDRGKYQCLATNKYGTIVSKEASLQFGYLERFPTEERQAVEVNLGVGVMLLCAAPPHFPDDLTYRWLLNEFPRFIMSDKRRFVSQTTGNLYIAKVEESDVGNFSCIVTSPSISKSVFSKYIPLIPQTVGVVKRYPADIKVRFTDTQVLMGQNLTLECFALGNPIPEIRWWKQEGSLPSSAELLIYNSVLRLTNIQPEDEGTYVCEAENSKATDRVEGRLTVHAHPYWIRPINDTMQDIGSDFTWHCEAGGKPQPTYKWLHNGEVVYGARFRVVRGELRISRLTLQDSGMYQCVTENKYGSLYSSAELKVLVLAPDFRLNPVKRKLLGARGGKVLMDCKPRAAPKPTFTWTKGTELIKNNSRMSIWFNGTLEIRDLSEADEGVYTCFAENNRGKANSSGTLIVTEPTKITLEPSNIDITVGENGTMECHASHDPMLDLSLIWSTNGYTIDFEKEKDYMERKIENRQSGELFFKNAQLRHTGKYTCTAKTTVDSVSASADLIVRGPPGPPGGVRVENIGDTFVTLTWSRGTDNHSPISKYTIRQKFVDSDEWKDARTDPQDIEGNMETAKVIDLIPWMDYEFSVVATNTLGLGEPSLPSAKIRTAEAAPTVAPSDVGGGGGNHRELTVTWTPLPREYHYGSSFGYIVAFKPSTAKEWRKVTVPNPEGSRYVHKDDSLSPRTPFEVKVKAFNSKGNGPFSLSALIYSAEDEPSEAPQQVTARSLSSSEIEVMWSSVTEPSVEGYEIRYRRDIDTEAAAQRVRTIGTDTMARIRDLKPHTRYYVEVRAYNKAGVGPSSQQIAITTRKAPPSMPPKIIDTARLGTYFRISWEAVTPLDNESNVEGYKVLYRRAGTVNSTLLQTVGHNINIPIHDEGDYIVEVRAYGEGGDGAVNSVKISKSSGVNAQVSYILLSFGLIFGAVSCLEL
ncbi:contactin 1b isoform X1 [Stegostoma tigrinum]|uniref:contactin 1b isoform X1 n=1 Tax=Stegostoma tigrinum TaxID=3053191 RepID=UPI0028708DDE|nr:contactin 1b isoform X1 [Stegostoma tigrinum]XP_059508287.1 contactin 1b isoform X1 [Stegostoma tigrinum]XP_059508288.1 contactin 1b isoform X1 [Stegostoma tigrinum]XP_059508289.1 contactin 1b isoform X1 [Stegostoma tigrinum]XP_059508290.1 contactin 1b isoform X1 [Stegostoma tigrinum]XP_059508291.1 contactin 1b isoform X1 [Stegostoma tigrinum]XP_059508292.1 contactin 1b isoform X1 [Stegostoma tigrinum]XP_059508293.1 contactin 1b isoform X1 [Stegostoma tigrinum]XP_059508294.1 contactin 1b